MTEESPFALEFEREGLRADLTTTVAHPKNPFIFAFSSVDFLEESIA